MTAQALQQLRRVGGAVADVVGNAIRETFGGAKFGRRSLVVGHWALGIRTRLQLSGEKRWKLGRQAHEDCIREDFVSQARPALARDDRSIRMLHQGHYLRSRR